jgi:hypothetical protein
MSSVNLALTLSLAAIGLSILTLSRMTTDDIAEGTTNKYFSDALARGAISAGSYIDYDPLTGVVGVDHIPADHSIFVDKSGNDSTGDGSILKPLLTIQAAHTLALTYSNADYVHIMVGPGDFTEDVTITRVKTAIIGSLDALNKTTVISSLTVNVTTSVSGLFNDIISINNILIRKSSGTSICTLGGNQQYTFNLHNSYLYTEGATTSCLQVTNTSSGGIRLTGFKCIIQNDSSNAASAIFSNVNNGRFDNCTFYAGSNSCMSITTSNITAYNTSFQTNTGSNVIDIVSSLGTPFNPISAPTGSIGFTCGNCSFLSTTTNGSGIVMAANSTSTVAQSVFAILPGTGSSIGGSATCYYINGNNLVYPGRNSTVAGTVTRLNMTAL